jgi:hypothetical protein
LLSNSPFHCIQCIFQICFFILVDPSQLFSVSPSLQNHFEECLKFDTALYLNLFD